MSTNSNTTNIPDQRFAEAPRIDFHGIPDESNIDALARFLAVLIILALKSHRGRVVLRVQDWNNLNDMVSWMFLLFTEWPRRSFRKYIENHNNVYMTNMMKVLDIVNYENVAVHIADGDNPRWIELAGLAG